MNDPAVEALSKALEASKASPSSSLFVALDRLLGFRLSDWKAQGEVIREQIINEYKEAQERGLGLQYATAFREKANLVTTLAKAASFVKKGFSREIEMEEDVFWGLINHAKQISNDDIQNLIAHIIAGEYNVPGSYSMSTLQTLKFLGKSELELFEKTCSLLLDNEQIPVQVFRLEGNYTEFIEKRGVKYEEFQMLMSFGLFNSTEATRKIANVEKRKIKVNYFDKSLVYELIGAEVKSFDLPEFHSLTPVGRQILLHLNPQFNDYYYAWLRENYKVADYKLL